MYDSISDIREWTMNKWLKLNVDKTKFLIMGRHQQLQKVQFDAIQVGELNVITFDKMRNLGVIFDKELGFKYHIIQFGNQDSFTNILIREVQSMLL